MLFLISSHWVSILFHFLTDVILLWGIVKWFDLVLQTLASRHIRINLQQPILVSQHWQTCQNPPVHAGAYRDNLCNCGPGKSGIEVRSIEYGMRDGIQQVNWTWSGEGVGVCHNLSLFSGMKWSTQNSQINSEFHLDIAACVRVNRKYLQELSRVEGINVPYSEKTSSSQNFLIGNFPVLSHQVGIELILGWWLQLHARLPGCKPYHIEQELFLSYSA